VELEKPQGKNDGSVNGVRYFTTPPNHGVFIRPGLVSFPYRPSLPHRTKLKRIREPSKPKTSAATPVAPSASFKKAAHAAVATSYEHVHYHARLTACRKKSK
jgi:hypothetical protein